MSSEIKKDTGMCQHGNFPAMCASCSEVVRSPEVEKTPYFIREATLESTLERLREVEPTKRKIIVYVGVHPNEGTDMLTQKYAAVWAEKYGATVVCQPTEDTPQALWARHEKETNGDTSIPLSSDTVLDEMGHAGKFTLGNNDIFVVRLHGTPFRYAQNRTKPGLDVITSRFTNHPEDFIHSVQDISLTYPDITSSLGDVIVSDNSDVVENRVREEDSQGPEDKIFLEVTPNTLLVEYYYDEGPKPVVNPYIQELMRISDKAWSEENHFPFAEQDEKWKWQLKMGLEYLDQPTLSDDAIALFDGVIVKDFEKILQHISDRLPNTTED